MLDQIRNIICQYVDVYPEEIGENTKLTADLGINSFDLVCLVGAVEDEFDVKIPDRDVLQLVTVKDVIEYLNRKM